MIPFIDLKQEYNELKPQIDNKIQDILGKGQFVLGNELTVFEQAFAKYVNTRYAWGVNSGTDAIFLALKALGIKKNDEVITSSHSFISTADGITRTGANPVFVDIDPDTYCIDPAKIEERISKQTKAILPVHLYGHPADMKPIMDTAEDKGLFVIEDACQAHGSVYRNQKTGSIGDIGCFSFYPTKNLGCYGDGGIITTNDEKISKKIALFRNYGQSKKYYHDCIGINSRLDEIQAGILNVKLSYLDSWNKKRRQVAYEYNKNFKCVNIGHPLEKGDIKHVYYLYVIQLPNRDIIQQRLLDRGIQTQIHYPIPIHKQIAYKSFNKMHLEVTERICNNILSLPMHPWVTKDQIEYISEQLTDAID